MNPKAGSGVQQTRSPCAEQTVEVVRNHEGGTRSASGIAGTKGRRLRAHVQETTRRRKTAKRHKRERS
jgi:hypothetical protein